jgi:Ca2+-binding RTX toxin-like protein
MIRDQVFGTSGAHRASYSRRCLCFEGLEDRRLLAIVWANRGDDSDQFDAAFDDNAEVARNVVDSALREWNRVVTGYQGNAFDLEMTIMMDPTNTSVSASASNTVRDDSGVPTSGDITINLGLDAMGNSLWYLDPTPDDHSEFMGTLENAFARTPTPGGPADGMRDLRTLLIHEIGHTLGVSSGSPLIYSNQAITMTNTGITDNTVGSGGNSYWLFQGPSINVVMTDFDINAIVTSTAGHNAAQTPGNQPIVFNQQAYYSAIDTMQPSGLSVRRILLTNKVALMMQDMGYDIVMPELTGTFHSVLDTETGILTIQGGTDNTLINNIDQGASSDTIIVQRNGNSLRVSIDIGVDVPGTGPGFLPRDQQDAFLSFFDVSDINGIRIEGFGGADRVELIGNFEFLDDLEVFGGAGTDIINGSAMIGSQGMVAFGDDQSDTLIGSPADDRLFGGTNSDTIDGRGGNDFLVGASGNDIMTGGSGNDRMIGGEFIDALDAPMTDLGQDELDGGAGEDSIIGDDGSFLPLIIRENAGGNDTILGGLNDDLIFGGAGNDEIQGQGGNDVIAAGRGNDLVIGGSALLVNQSLSDGDDFINGGDGNDRMYGDNFSNQFPPSVSLQGGNDEMIGGTGIDVMYGQAGHDSLQGNDGNDTLDGGFGNDELQGGVGNDSIVAGDGTDLVFGDSGNDVLRGGDDNDILVGGTGNDDLFGENGDDLANGEDGNDLIAGGDGDDRISGGDGNDKLIGGNYSAVVDLGADQIDGDGGDDLIFGDSGTVISQNLATLAGGADTIRGGLGNDTIHGGPGNDFLVGNAGQDYVLGQVGDDWIIGGNFAAFGTPASESDADILNGGDGQDILLGDSWSREFPFVENSIGGNDLLNGGADNDFIAGQAGRDTMYGESGEDQLVGGEGNDVIRGGTGNDSIAGGRGNDQVDGQDGDDMIRGEDGDDTLTGGNGNDILLGGGGFDSIAGNVGRDLLIGGRNSDRMNGSEDNDILIGGITAFDSNDAALQEIMHEWTSARSYSERVANLRGVPNPTFANRLNNNTFLQDGITVIDDAEVDHVSGGSGLDWFLLDQLAPSPDDVIFDWELEEEVN